MAYRVLLVVSAFALASPSAHVHAETARIVDGGPRGKSQRRSLEASLARAVSAASVCFKRAAPASIAVDLRVAPGGKVTSATAKTDGAVAQCVAGILAVVTLDATGKNLRFTVAFDTRALSGGSIADALSPYQEKLKRCRDQASDKSRAARAVLQFLIHPDGRVERPKVSESDLKDRKVEQCLVKTMTGARLGKGVTAKKVRYTLNVAFPAVRDTATGAAAGPDKAAQPSKDGPLSGREISKVMRERRDAFHQCYAKRVRKNRSLAGRVILRFTIRDDGTVRNVKIKETALNNAKVENCIVKIGKTLQFPASSGETRVFFPFVFSVQ